MKKYLDVRNGIIILLLLIVIIEFINPKGIMPNRIEVVTKTDSIPYPIHDTVPVESLVEVEVEVPVPYEVEKRVEIPVTQFIDTLAILKDFNAKNELKEQLILPGNLGVVNLNQVISQNKVISREFDAKITPKTVRDTIYTPTPRKTEVYYGFFGGLNRADVMPSVGLGVMLKTKNDKIIHGGLGVYNRVSDNGVSGTLTPYISGGVYWKIKLKK
jgi:hypothetical protein